jgi:peptidoglycan/xylan/chitin deacetylase (PgdA/CDA1 family)
MSSRRDQRDQRRHARERATGTTRGRLAAFGSLIVVAAVVAVILVASVSGSKSRHSGATSAAAGTHPKPASPAKSAPGAGGQAGTTAVPILVYHVINAQPAQSTANPSLYVPVEEFSSHMRALKAGGWHAVTLDQLQAYWTRGVSLGPGKPIVLTFDSGYASQYTNALPVLERLGWRGVENLEVTGLPPSEGGLADAQIRALIAAGWELDSQGLSQADLTSLGTAALTEQVATARQTLRSRYGVPVNWFSYPSGDYDPTVIAAVRAAGYVGATTVNQGWASPKQDRYRLPRLVVKGGVSPSELLAQIASAKASTSVPPTFSGPGVA